MMRIAYIAGLGGLMLAGAGLAAEPPVGDPAAGRKLAGMCRTCHGIDGYAKVPIAPHIGGENPAYISHQLSAFRSGARQHEMMSVVAASLSDQQIADLAAWFSAQTPEVTLTADETGAPEQCVACHGVDGIAQIEDAPNLAGETNIYIETQLKAFRYGKRSHEIMSVIASELSDEEMRQAADWYSSVKLSITMPQ